LSNSKMNLVAVQARMDRGDYQSAETFYGKIAGLMEQASRQADFSLPTLVSFPELIGMFLSFLPRYWDDLKDEPALEAGAMKIVMKNFPSLPEEQRQTPEAAGRRLLFIDTALEAERIYAGTFSSLARDFGVYVGAGSIALPPVEDEPSLGGRHLADEGRVFNTSYLFSPRGVCLSRVPKAHMTPGFEERVFDAAPESALLPVRTRLGCVGTLVCYDGFFETLVERYDALGVDILLKPSYNQHPWNGPSSYDPQHLEGEQWLRTGCPSIIQGRENIRYGVNAMLVGAVFEDVAAEGLSSVAANTGRPGASWEEGVLAIAGRPDAEEIVAATVALDAGAR
jgi:predicted amidohydrolase